MGDQRRDILLQGGAAEKRVAQVALDLGLRTELTLEGCKYIRYEPLDVL